MKYRVLRRQSIKTSTSTFENTMVISRFLRFKILFVQSAVFAKVITISIQNMKIPLSENVSPAIA